MKKIKSLEIFEIIHRGEITELLFFVSVDQAAEVEKSTQDFQSLSHIVFKNPHASLLKAYLNVENSDLGDQLLSFENRNLSQLLAFMQDCLVQGWKPVELRYPRSTSGSGYVLMTAGGLNNGRELAQKWSSVGTATALSNPGLSLQNYYNLKPLA